MHVHISVDASLDLMQERLPKLRKGTKITTLRLWRGERSQLDSMFTLHCPPDGFRRLYQLCAEVRSLGFKVTRFKIEEDLLGTPSWEYLEIHARTPTLEPNDPTASYSLNLQQVEKGIFQTFRMLDWQECDRKVVELRSQGFTDIWQEAVINDSNPVLDDWWCPRPYVA